MGALAYLGALILVLINVLLATEAVAPPPSPADKLDPRYVSQLRVELRNVPRPEQCLLFWKGVSEKLQDVADYSLPDDGADFELLADLSRMLNYHRAYHKLSEFVDECATILSYLPKSTVASHTSRERSLMLQDQQNQDLELEKLRKEVASLEEKLAQKDKLLKEQEEVTKIKIDKLNVGLLAREHQLQEANKAKESGSKCLENEKSLLQQVEELKKEVALKDKQIGEAREASSQEVANLKKDLEEKSKALDDKNKAIEDKDKAIDEKNKVIDEKNKVIDEKNKVIDEKNKEVEEKNKVIDEKNKEVDEKSKEVNEKIKEVDEKSKALEEKSKELERRLEASESLTKEKDKLLKDLEKLKLDLQAKEQQVLGQKDQVKCSLENEQKKFDEVRKGLTDKVTRLEAEVKKKENVLNDEKKKCSKQLDEANKLIEELKRKSNKILKPEKKSKPVREEVKDNAVPETWDGIVHLYERVFYDNSRPLDPARTLDMLRVLERVLKGYKDPEVRNRYKIVDRFISVSKLKQKRCTKSDWDKLNDLIKNSTTSANIDRYLKFWLVQREDYCARFYPNMKF